jgi:hypothetical protein
MTLKHGVNTSHCHEKPGAYEKRPVFRYVGKPYPPLVVEPASDPDLLASLM